MLNKNIKEDWWVFLLFLLSVSFLNTARPWNGGMSEWASAVANMASTQWEMVGKNYYCHYEGEE